MVRISDLLCLMKLLHRYSPIYRSLSTFLSQDRTSLEYRGSSYCLLAFISLRITWVTRSRGSKRAERTA